MDNYCLKNGIYVCDDVFNAILGSTKSVTSSNNFLNEWKDFILECVNTHDIYISLFAIQL